MTHVSPETSSESAAEAIKRAVRFARVLRYRKSYIFSSLAVAGLLGSLYFFTATRIYQATASLLVTQNGGEMTNTSMTAEAARDALIPTYERLFTSAVVLEGAIQRLLDMPAGTRIDFEGVPRDQWPDTLRNSLSAQAIRRTNIIELSYLSRSPAAAEAVVAAVLDAYLEFMDKNHKDVSFQVAGILQNNLEKKEAELRLKQESLLRLEEASGALGLPEKGTLVHPIVQRVVRLNETLIDTQEQRLQLEASLAAIRTAVRNGGDLRQHLLALEPTVGRELIMNALGLSPQFAEISNQIEHELIEDRARLLALQEYYGPTHPEVVELRLGIQGAEQRLADYQSQVNSRLKGIAGEQLGPMLIGMIEERLATIWQNERQLMAEYELNEAKALKLNGRMAELELARNEVRRLTNWHETLLNQIANIDLRQEHNNMRVAIVGEPLALAAPISPRLPIVGLFCLVGGVGVGAVMVYVLDLLDDRFRSPDELKEQIGAPVLAMIRRLSVSSEGGIESLHVHTAPSSVESEAFRTLRTTLAFSGQDMQRVAITSSEPGDGKTTVIANLGVTYAQAGKKTLLIDCDLRRPGLSKLFQLRRTKGLTDILRDEADVSDLCQAQMVDTGIDNLQVIPCGPKPPDPTEALSHTRFAEVIAWAETHFDQVLIDCPPVMAASDAAIVGRMVDGMVLVVQPEKNHRRLVLRAAESLTAVGVNLIGIVANRVGTDRENGYYDYGYGYSYGYGHDEEDGDGQEDDVPLERPRAA